MCGSANEHGIVAGKSSCFCWSSTRLLRRRRLQQGIIILGPKTYTALPLLSASPTSTHGNLLSSPLGLTTRASHYFCITSRRRIRPHTRHIPLAIQRIRKISASMEEARGMPRTRHCDHYSTKIAANPRSASLSLSLKLRRLSFRHPPKRFRNYNQAGAHGFPHMESNLPR